jgi:hypothetical protein
MEAEAGLELHGAEGGRVSRYELAGALPLLRRIVGKATFPFVGADDSMDRTTTAKLAEGMHTRRRRRLHATFPRAALLAQAAYEDGFDPERSPGAGASTTPVRLAA